MNVRPSKILTEDAERQLFLIINEDEKRSARERARNTVILAFEPLAARVVSEIYRKTPRRAGFDKEDLLQQAREGIALAIEKFDHTTGNRFSAYAEMWIYGHVTKYVMSNWGVVRIGTRLFREMFFKNKQEIMKLHQMGTDTSELEVDDSELSQEKQRMLMHMSLADESLDRTITDDSGEGGTTIGETFADESVDTELTVVSTLTMNTIKEVLFQENGLLNAKELYVINNRYLKEPAMSFRELGKRLGVSHDTADKLEKSALRKLSEHFKK